jgi:hypothetical protein
MRRLSDPPGKAAGRFATPPLTMILATDGRTSKYTSRSRSVAFPNVLDIGLNRGYGPPAGGAVFATTLSLRTPRSSRRASASTPRRPGITLSCRPHAAPLGFGSQLRARPWPVSLSRPGSPLISPALAASSPSPVHDIPPHDVVDTPAGVRRLSSVSFSQVRKPAQNRHHARRPAPTETGSAAGLETNRSWGSSAFTGCAFSTGIAFASSAFSAFAFARLAHMYSR